jgi:hypothetical protein
VFLIIKRIGLFLFLFFGNFKFLTVLHSDHAVFDQ